MNVLCGKMAVSWKDLLDLLELCARFDVRLHRDEENIVGRPVGEALFVLDAIRASVQDDQQGKECLVDLLRITQHFEATQPQDKVFALLGLAKDSSEFFKYVKYSPSVARAFCDVAETVVKCDVPIKLLGQVRRPKRVASLPSWVPD